ncbi:DUF1616 domain-containing protein [Halorientalis marina]|uniref:DUF1616 domain-containing protein n=1 Tax=Halorientalis marina TaxID=2931976 RepID=UPI001FF68E4D|nr:DUF1616 domain-containing protein [Halorientalis marina]
MQDHRRVLTWIMALILGSLIATVMALAVNPAVTNPPSTELYVLNNSENSSDYLDSLRTGEETGITIGVNNHEHHPVTYRVVAKWNESTTAERRLRVSNGGTRELQMRVTAPNQSGRYRLRFLLFNPAQNQTTPDLTTRLWIHVSDNDDK